MSSQDKFKARLAKPSHVKSYQVKPSHIKSNQTCRIQNPDIPRAGRLGAARGGVAGRGGAGYSGTPTGRSDQSTVLLAPQGIEHNCRERLFGSTNKGIPM